MRTVHAFCLGLMGVLASACSHTEDDSASGSADLAEATTPRKGSTITSPSVDANKTYWGARRIDNLVAVGYLTADEANVARRADGIIANSPPNGFIGVDELA